MPEVKIVSIMSEAVITAGQSMPLGRVLKLMAVNRISAIVIVEDDIPLGIFTERDAVSVSIGRNLNLESPVGAFMTRNPVCVSKDKDIEAAYQSMQELAIRHLVVVEASGSLAGLITEEDFLTHLDRHYFEHIDRIEKIMSRNLVTAQENESFYTGLQRMAQRRISCLVVGIEQKALGILTERDAVNLLLQGVDQEGTMLSQLISRPLYSIDQNESLSSARQRMLEKGVRRLLVTDGEKRWIGLITRHDLAKVMDTRFRRTLERQESHFRRLYEQAPLPYQSLDAKGVLLEVNREWLITFDYTKEQVIGRFIGEFLVPGQEELLEHQFARFISDGQVSGAEFRLMCGNGRQKLVRVDGHVVQNEAGNFLHTNCILTDITETRQTQEALRSSEFKFRNLVESTPAVVYQATLPPNFTTTYLSPSAERIIGYTQKDVDTTPDCWVNAIHPEDRDWVKKTLENYQEQQGLISVEYRCYTKGGRLIWVRDDVRVEYDVTGRATKFHGVVLDITERKKLEAELRKSNSELEALINSIPAPVYFMDRELHYKKMNKATLDFFGLLEDEVIGRTNRDLFPEELAKEFELSDRIVLVDGKSFENAEEPVTDYAGNLRWFNTTKTPIINDKGEVSGLVGISFEITELKQAEQQRRLEEQQQRNALIQEVHHRIKNHLQGVVNLMRLQSKDKLPDPLREESIISQIRTIADVYGLQSDSETGHVYVCDMVDAALKVHQATCKQLFDYRHERIARAALVASESVPVALVINELITNAIKHTPRDRTDEPISIRLRTDATRAYMTVRNPAHALPEGFDPKTGEKLGTGLRLVRTLLPHDGSRLVIHHSMGVVSAELSLESPVVALVSSKS